VTAKLNKLQAITVFTRVADEGGFTAAAARLGLSVSAVTKIILRLEAELEARLFHRTTRSLALTECGQLYYRCCQSIMAELDDAEAMMRTFNSKAEGQVRLVMPYSIGRDILIPALAEFYHRYPSIGLEMIFRGGEVDLVKEGFDLAIRIGNLSDSGLIRRVLLNTPMATVASPDYLQKSGIPGSPTDLLSHNCIVGRRVGAEWRYMQNGRRTSVMVSGNLYLDNSDAIREAAVAGLGIAHSSVRLFRRDLEQGTLVLILDEYEYDEVPVSVLYPDKKHLPAKVLTVIDFLEELMRDVGSDLRRVNRKAMLPVTLPSIEKHQRALKAVSARSRVEVEQSKLPRRSRSRLRQVTIDAAKISRSE